MREVGVGVVGLGRLGLQHARNVAAEVGRARLAAVCELRGDLAEATARELGCSAYSDLSRLLDECPLDALVVATPSAGHVEPVLQGLEAGLAVFCEKPLASNLEDTLRLAEAAAKAGTPFQVGFNRRFDPGYREARAMIARGDIGVPVYYGGVSRDPFPPPPWACDPGAGGGLFVDMLLHDFDAARYLLGDEVESVFAEETAMVVDGGGVERFADNVTVSLRFAGGALGHCHGSMHACYGYDVRGEVYGERGSIAIGGLERTALWVAAGASGVRHPSTYLGEGGTPHFVERFRESYVEELRHFVSCVADGERPEVNQDDAVAAFAVSLACIRSAGEGRRVAIGEIGAEQGGEGRKGR